MKQKNYILCILGLLSMLSSDALGKTSALSKMLRKNESKKKPLSLEQSLVKATEVSYELALQEGKVTPALQAVKVVTATKPLPGPVGDKVIVAQAIATQDATTTLKKPAVQEMKLAQQTKEAKNVLTRAEDTDKTLTVASNEEALEQSIPQNKKWQKQDFDKKLKQIQQAANMKIAQEKSATQKVQEALSTLRKEAKKQIQKEQVKAEITIASLNKKIQTLDRNNKNLQEKMTLTQQEVQEQITQALAQNKQELEAHTQATIASVKKQLEETKTKSLEEIKILKEKYPEQVIALQEEIKILKETYPQKVVALQEEIKNNSIAFQKERDLLALQLKETKQQCAHLQVHNKTVQEAAQMALKAQLAQAKACEARDLAHLKNDQAINNAIASSERLDDSLRRIRDRKNIAETAAKKASDKIQVLAQAVNRVLEADTPQAASKALQAVNEAALETAQANTRAWESVEQIEDLIA
ncbi:MAG: hypothetical protein NTX86_01715 [Candidatus Dependentiae bacterium]|nr:hypothetical protein [Candidatus Dependentiae bacterium]